MHFCCTTMSQALEFNCSQHADPYECGDQVIYYSEKYDEYGLIIHDGGSSSYNISYCPWCGSKLPPSRRDEWFDKLEALGIDPHEDDIPPEFETSAWYRSDEAQKPMKNMPGLSRSIELF